MAQEHIFGVHGHVRLELALPPPSWLLKVFQVGGGEPQGVVWAPLDDHRAV